MEYITHICQSEQRNRLERETILLGTLANDLFSNYVDFGL